MDESPIVKQIRRDLEELRISQSLRDLSNSSVLITGASGMLGIYFTVALAVLQIESQIEPRVTAVSRKPVSLFESLPIRNVRPQKTRELLLSGGIDVVIHAASPAHASVFMQDPKSCFEVNVTSASEIALDCMESGTKFVYISSGEVYGVNPPVPTSETDFGGLDPVISRNIYAESKRAGEALLSSLASSQNLDLRICRFFHTFGPGIRSNEPRLFGALVDAALEERDCLIVGNADATRSFLYSFDALDGIAHSIDKLPSDVAVNVAGGPPFTVRETALLAMSAMTEGRHGVKFEEGSHEFALLESKISRNEANNSLLKSTGWLPQVSLSDAFSRTLNSITGKL